MDFKNASVLITGGASGIGKIMCRKSIERGCSTLVIWDINEEGLSNIRQELSHPNVQIFTYQIDLSQAEEIEKTSTQTLAEAGKIDILINNAGIVVGKNFIDHSVTDIEKSMLINAQAPMLTARAFLLDMIHHNHGAICNIASSAGLIFNPKMSVYAASKWAVVGWSDSLRLEMKKSRKNISVTTIMSYYINTGMFDGVKSKILPILDPEKISEKIMRSIERRKTLVAVPLPYWFIRLSQGIFPQSIYDALMDKVFGIYDSMTDFKGRKA